MGKYDLVYHIISFLLIIIYCLNYSDDCGKQQSAVYNVSCLFVVEKLYFVARSARYD